MSIEEPSMKKPCKPSYQKKPGDPLFLPVDHQFVHYHPNPLIRRIPSYIKDTTDFLLTLQDLNNLPLNYLLATLDVTSLYMNIRHNEGIEACREDIIHLLKLILGRKNFTFED